MNNLAATFLEGASSSRVQKPVFESGLIRPDLRKKKRQSVGNEPSSCVGNRELLLVYNRQSDRTQLTKGTAFVTYQNWEHSGEGDLVFAWLIEGVRLREQELLFEMLSRF